jgi:hypothetical protein
MKNCIRLAAVLACLFAGGAVRADMTSPSLSGMLDGISLGGEMVKMPRNQEVLCRDSLSLSPSDWVNGLGENGEEGRLCNYDYRDPWLSRRQNDASFRYAGKRSSVGLMQGLTFLLPGIGHLMNLTPGAIIMGVLHLAISALEICGIVACVRSGGPSWGGVAAAVFLINSVIHRIVSVFEIGCWANNSRIARKDRVVLSAHYSKEDTGQLFGASVSVGF